MPVKDVKFSSQQLEELKMTVKGCLETLNERPKIVEVSTDKENKRETKVAPAAENKGTTKQTATPTEQGKGKTAGHVMLSYNQRSSQRRVIKLRNKLKSAGIPTWMDIDDMTSGDLFQSMAKAIENAAIVLVCVSREYKGSANCRREASYACKQKKQMLFVRVEDYEPDEWLGLMEGTSLYYNIVGENFEANANLLIKHIKEIYAGMSIEQLQQQPTGANAAAQQEEAAPEGAHAVPVGTTHKQKDEEPAWMKWSCEEVQSWLQTSKLDFLLKQFVSFSCLTESNLLNFYICSIIKRKGLSFAIMFYLIPPNFVNIKNKIKNINTHESGAFFL